jgi:protein Mpv17
MIAQCGTAAVLFGAGDVIAQQAIEKKGLKGHDWARTARLTFYGGALFGPIVTKWFQFLNRIQFPSAAKSTIYRVGLDQGIMAPAHVAFFFTTMTLLEGNSFADAKGRLNHAYVTTLTRNWGVFIPTQIINFALVPHHLRFFVVGVVSLFWNTYLSAVNAQQQAAPAIEGELVRLE